MLLIQRLRFPDPAVHDAGELDRGRARRSRFERGAREGDQFRARREDALVRGVRVRLPDVDLHADEDVRVPELDPGGALRVLDVVLLDDELAGFVEPAAVAPLPGGGKAGDVLPHQLGDHLGGHRSSTSGGRASGMSGGVSRGASWGGGPRSPSCSAASPTAAYRPPGASPPNSEN